jgi:drug/metabolite transporter (DMT)-like permease
MKPGIHRNGLLPHLAILCTVVFWGMSFASNKVILNAGVPPMTLAFLRYFIATGVLLPILKRREPGFVINRSVRRPLVISSVIGISLYFFFELNGIQRTDMLILSPPLLE